MIVLSWRFELSLAYYINKWPINEQFQSEIEHFSSYLSKKTIKENLLNKAKSDLSSELNRSNFHLWKQYGLLKWILNNNEHFNQPNQNAKSKMLNIKETRKVFDTLLNTSASANDTSIKSCIDIYSLCIDYFLIEIDAFHRLFDIETSHFRSCAENKVSLPSFGHELSLFDLEKMTTAKKKEYMNAKECMSELLIANCLKKSKLT